MKDLIASDEVKPKAGEIECVRCKIKHGEWVKKYSEHGSYWSSTCERCGNERTRSAIMPGEFLDAVNGLAKNLKGESE